MGQISTFGTSRYRIQVFFSRTSNSMPDLILTKRIFFLEDHEIGIPASWPRGSFIRHLWSERVKLWLRCRKKKFIGIRSTSPTYQQPCIGAQCTHVYSKVQPDHGKCVNELSSQVVYIATNNRWAWRRWILVEIAQRVRWVSARSRVQLSQYYFFVAFFVAFFVCWCVK